MVNYCCVAGCGRNSRLNKHLNYYGLPKERHRQEEWLKAAGRQDLLGKESGKSTISYRFCSRHFAPSSIKNRNLCTDAIPSLYLPGSQIEEESESDQEHRDVICDSCTDPVMGFRYKCVTCPDYDLCQKCEMNETHAHHFMLRIPRPVKFKQADNLVKKWRQFFLSKHATPNSPDQSDSSDNEPITKYATRNNTSSDIPEEMKIKIQAEITRVLSLNHGSEDNGSKTPKKRKAELDKSSKKTKESEVENGIEMVFADVNELNSPFMDVPI